MEIDENKLKRQLEGKDKWYENNCIGIFNWATGVGKSYLTKLCVEFNEKEQRDSYMIIVERAGLVVQWQKNINNYFPKHLAERFLIKTVQSLLNEDIRYEVGVLIIDEIHKFATELRVTVLDNIKIKYKKFIGLTANADDKNFRLITKYVKVIDTITIEEAKEKGFVADFIEYNLGLDFNKREQSTYDAVSETISKHMPKFDNDLTLANKILVGGKDKFDKFYSGAGWSYGLAKKRGWYKELDLRINSHREIDDLWNPNKIIGYAKALINAVRIRKDLIYNANSKFDTTLNILKKINNVKTIIFSESTAFSDKIGNILNDNNCPTVVYHSQLKTVYLTSPISGKLIKCGKVKLKKIAIDSIKSGKARVISTTRSMDEGIDIPDLRMSINTSSTSNTTQDTQRRGRTIRKEKGNEASNVPVLLINLYIKNTQDEAWLNKKQANLGHKPIVITSVEDITYKPPANYEFNILDL
jgi:superfamily II DNA or RNA helicase